MNCEYCGSAISSMDTRCTNCGAGTPNFVAQPPAPTYQPPQPPYQPHPQSPFTQPYYQQPALPKMNGMALTGGILALVSLLCNFCGLVGLLALIFSIVGITQINARGERGRGWAITGIILGVIGIAWGLLASMIIWAPMFYI